MRSQEKNIGRSFLTHNWTRFKIRGVWAALGVLLWLIFYSPAQADPCIPPVSGIVGWWSGNNSTVDNIGTNPGTLNGSAGYDDGKVGSGFSLDGTSAYVLLNNSTNLNLQNFTIEAWVKRSSSSNPSKDPQGSGHIFGFGNDGYAFGMHQDGSLFLTQVGVTEADVALAVTDTSFHHLAVTKTNSTVIFYVDGIASSPVSLSTTFLFTTQPAIGIRADALANGFWGIIDELAFYNRALSTQELQNIYNAGSAGKCVPPANDITVLTQPVGQNIFVGGFASFYVEASSTNTLSYQWFFNGAAINNASNSSFSITNAQLSDSGSYSVLITNQLNQITSVAAVLNVTLPCWTPPDGLVAWWPGENNANDIIGGNNGSLSGNATFAPGQSGQGFIFDGNSDYVDLGNPTVLQVQNFTIETWIKRSSASAVSHDGQGNAHLFGFGQPGYGIALHSNGTPFLTQTGITETGITTAISGTNFHHLAVTKTNSTVVFYIDGQPKGTNSFSPTFTFPLGATIGNRGDTTANGFWGTIDELSVYTRALSANDIQGIFLASSQGKCQSPNPPFIFIQPTNSYIGVGAQSKLNILASGNALSYQWFFNSNAIISATNSSLLLTNAQIAQAGTYFVTVSNELGFLSSSNAVIVVGFAPVIISQPATAFASYGQMTNLSVTTTGDAPLNFQWQRNGSSILAATNSSLNFSNVSQADIGTYRVIVSNLLGSVTSSNAVVTLNPIISVNSQVSNSFTYTNISSRLVTITSTFSNATIFYTLDGSIPDFDSIIYSGTFTITQSCLIKAVAFDASFNSSFSAPVPVSLYFTYALSVTNPGGGSVVLNPSGGVYLNTQTVQATATASNGWTFIRWAGDVSSTNPVVNVSMERPKTIMPVFGAPVTVTPPVNGTIKLNPALTLYPYGSLLQASGIPNPGYSFSIWGGSVSTPTNPLPLLINATNLSISALFSSLPAGKFSLTVLPNGSGTIAVTPRANNYSSGTAISISATPLSSNVFYYWSGDATGTNNPLNLTMDTNKVITVNFSGGNFPIQLGVARTNNSVRLSLAGEPTKVFDVQGSTNLNAWGTISTLTNTNGTVIFNDSLTSSNKFYRAKLH